MTDQPADPAASAPDWRDGVVYQIYPRSFADHDGNGVGDLPGILDHLDHFRPDNLPIEAIWLSPIYPSPGRDLGYDVTDHTRVDPLLGTEADFDRLVAESHRRGIKVILDLVMNHTSNESEWFLASKASREGPYADFYLWRDPSGWDEQGNPLPPNNWVSFFGGPGWEWVPERGQFYYHTFLVGQPELNWRNPAVEAAQWDMVRGWLKRGVDGFRLDVFNAYFKDPELRSNPVRAEGNSPWARLEHRYDIDQPDFLELIGRFRAILDEQPGRMSVGELFTGGTKQAAEYTSDRHIVFDWSLMESPWMAAAFGAAIDLREAAYGPDLWPTIALSNHDRERQATRLSASVGRDRDPDHDAIAKAAAVVVLAVRGTPFLYYGEEIGMVDVDIPRDEIVDPPALLAGPDFPWYDRSRCRTPMQWDDGPNAGFTTGRPWLRLAPDGTTRNVAKQSADPDSVLAAYRRLLAFRRTSAALQRGAMNRLDSGDPDVLAWTRGSGDETILVLVSFVGEERAIHVGALAGGRWAAQVGTHRELPTVDAAGLLRLRPDEAVILTRNGA
ncbi:MAG TPA: alpha-amylase family glycosyl hydrolase [Candidatus Bathyarchaeia archaeon]|jgi:alpha-glucosidase|nr:alpha-amylase family glycosyl hydrolase [Candidatus Bathyarchaeia archaeon]